MAALLCDVVIVFVELTHPRSMHAASYVDHEKKFVWFSISMHACDSVTIVMGLRLALELRCNVLLGAARFKLAPLSQGLIWYRI